MDFMKRKWYLLKSRIDLQFVNKITFAMFIGQLMKEEGHAQNYRWIYVSLFINLLFR